MLKVTPLTPSIGAIISKVSLNKDLNSGTIEQIYSALIKHQVVFFRDQNISPETHLKLAESLGEIDPGHPVYPHVEGYQSIVLLKNDANNRPDTNDWHKDLTFKESPPFASILHGVKVPMIWVHLEMTFTKKVVSIRLIML
jgi:taurine dioxygenase